MNTPHRILVRWTDDAQALVLATRRGWKNDTDGVLDYVDEAECAQEKEFATLKAARSWATRWRRRDLWSQPHLVVLEYPDAGRREQDATCVQRERYIGDGCGWESVQV